MTKSRRLLVALLVLIAGGVSMPAYAASLQEGTSVSVQDATMVQKPLPPAPPSEPAKPAPSPQKPYVPPALNNKPTPESNSILPPLYGWSRILMHDLKMPGSDEVVNNCGMKQDMIYQFFVNRLQEAGIPIVSQDQLSRLIPDVVTVEAEPSITSMEDLVINCISYVQFRVKMDITFRVPPMMYRRTVPILLWNDGTMVSSAKSTHNGALINAFITMADRFKEAWARQNSLKAPPQQLLGH